MVAFGWHMLPLYEARCDFPYHPGIRPLFVSFHLNRLELLTDEAREYLRRYGPVGCRDWSTVFLLLGAGIDAFFTGCLTTTIDAVYPEREAVYSGGGAVGVIDLPLHAAGVDAAVARRYTHQSEALRLASLADNLRTADGVLAAYQRDLDRAVTGRLHAYLPLTSLGVEVELRNANPGDMRFAGLTGLRPGDERLAEMQRGIRDLVAAAIGAVLSGAGEDDVYAQWRELARPLVAEARTRFQAPVVDPPPTFDVVAAATAIRSEGVRMGPHAGVDQATVTDVAVCVDGDRLFRAGVLVESLVATASGDVRLWVLDRGLTDASRAWLGSAFPAVPMTFLRRDGLPRAVAGRSVARLLLPVLLDRVDRVVCLDADGLALDDIGILARVDLGGRPLAARDAATSEAAAWRRAAARLPVTDAIELERRFAQVHGTGGAAIDAGVLVLDLERMRRDDAIGATMPLVERFGLTDEDCLLAWVGPDRAVLEPRWNAVPALDGVRDPGFVRWAGVGKPWEPRLTFGQDRWREHAAGLRSRAGPPPASDAATAAAVAGVASIPAGAHVVRADGEAELERVLAGRP